MDRCPYLYPLHILSRKWSYVLLRSMRESAHFSDLKRDLHFITNKVLSDELAQLQAEGLVHKGEQEHSYCITPSGRALLDAVEGLAAWSAQHAGCGSCQLAQECARCLKYPPEMHVRDYKGQRGSFQRIKGT